MRKDMAQLLVERPRLYRSSETYRGQRRRLNRDPDSASSKQGMRRPYIDRKQFNEYFAPIMGYLRKSCGRPWNKVFSELTASLSGGGTVIDHVKTHVLRDFVILKPVWDRGVACYPPHSYQGNRAELVPINARFNKGFYVDRQGTLRQAPSKRRKSFNKPKPQRIQIDAHSAYYKIDDLWFRVWTKPLETPGVDSVPVYDVLLKKWVKCRGYTPFMQAEMMWTWYVADGEGGDIRELTALHGSYDRVAYRKEQISNRTIRREKLNELLR